VDAQQASEILWMTPLTEFMSALAGRAVPGARALLGIALVVLCLPGARKPWPPGPVPHGNVPRQSRYRSSIVDAGSSEPSGHGT
jgi:hypothetical protein